MNDLLNAPIPNDINAERALLSAIINDKDAIIETVEKLEPGDFFKEEHKLIFDAVIDLFNQNISIDLVVLKNKIDEKGYIGKAIDIPFLADIASNVILLNNVKEYVKIIKGKSLLRNIIKTNREVLSMCYKNEESAETILETVERNIFDMLSKRSTSEFYHIKDVLTSTFDQIEEAYRNKGKTIGLPTGFVDLDGKLAGLNPSDMVLIAARPSMGKSSLALNIIEHVSIKHNIPTAFFSLEMSKEQITANMLSCYTMIDSQKMRTGNLSEADFMKMAEAMGTIAKAPIYIDDTPGISISELRAKCRKLKLEKNIQLVAIDYLQLMTGSGKNESRQQEISEISRNIKAIAKEINAPIIALSQLSRACEARNDHRPMLSDLRESGAIEQDADVVMFIYRDEYYNPMTEKKNQAEIIIAKQRRGPTGTVNLAWLASYTKFANMQN